MPTWDIATLARRSRRLRPERVTTNQPRAARSPKTVDAAPPHDIGFDEFALCYKPEARPKRKATWSEKNPDGRWRCFTDYEILKRDRLSLDLFWIKDQSLTNTESLPPSATIAAEIADELETALQMFSKIAARLTKVSQKETMLKG